MLPGIEGAQYALLNQMRTGNSIVDMFLAMLVTAVLGMVVTHWTQHVQPWLKQLMFALFPFLRPAEELPPPPAFARDVTVTFYRQNGVIREIEDRTTAAQQTGGDQFGCQSRALFVQMAIDQYICRHILPKSSPLDGEYSPTQNALPGPVSLKFDQSFDLGDGITFKKSTTEQTAATNKQQSGDDSGGGGGGGGGGGANTGSPAKQHARKFTFTCSAPDGDVRIDRFVKSAVDEYSEELAAASKARALVKIPRKLYALTDKKTKEDSYDSMRSYFVCEPADLSDNKTFKSMFFPNKAKWLNVINGFQTKKGSYKIPGVPHKLGLMLHGPPGTGKTSFIKAAANATGRSIVYIQLSKITCDDDFELLLTRPIIWTARGEQPLALSNVILMFDDIDASTYAEVLQPRTPETETSPTSSEKAALERLLQHHHLPSAAATAAAAHVPGLGLLGPKFGAPSLTLTGFLNALDGIPDTDGRFVIMTTNHIKKLDDAILRPGRIDHIIYFGHVTPTTALEMIRFYLPDVQLSDAAVQEITRLLTEMEVTPAEMERICISLAMSHDGDGEGDGGAAINDDAISDAATKAEQMLLNELLQLKTDKTDKTNKTASL